LSRDERRKGKDVTGYSLDFKGYANIWLKGLQTNLSKVQYRSESVTSTVAQAVRITACTSILEVSGWNIGRKPTILSELWGSHGRDYVEYCLLVSDAV
jgi:hypothetical protein